MKIWVDGDGQVLQATATVPPGAYDQLMAPLQRAPRTTLTEQISDFGVTVKATKPPRDEVVYLKRSAKPPWTGEVLLRQSNGTMVKESGMLELTESLRNAPHNVSYATKEIDQQAVTPQGLYIDGWFSQPNYLRGNLSIVAAFYRSPSQKLPCRLTKVPPTSTVQGYDFVCG